MGVSTSSTGPAPQGAEPASPSQAKPLVPDAGDVFRVRYPFVRCKATICGEDGPEEIDSWRPGVVYELCGPYGDTDIVAHGEGEMVLTVIDVHKPGRFPTRVFYTRKFVSPDGNMFGKGGLRMTTVDAFKRRASGYLLAYDVEDMANA
jgi:hypothetical protein